MNNIITIALCEEDRKRIDELIAFTGLIVSEMKSPSPVIVQEPIQAPTAPQDAPEQPDPVNEYPVEEDSPYDLPEPAAKPEQPKYTKDDVLAKVQSLAGPNNPKREEAKAIVKSYGTKVSDIPADKYAEVMDKLTALEG
jgi:hypothetical protein